MKIYYLYFYIVIFDRSNKEEERYAFTITKKKIAQSSTHCDGWMECESVIDQREIGAEL